MVTSTLPNGLSLDGPYRANGDRGYTVSVRRRGTWIGSGGWMPTLGIFNLRLTETANLSDDEYRALQLLADERVAG